jgi:SM-20-related protein
MATLFPYMHVHNFLSNTLNQEILAYGISKFTDFQPSKINKNGIGVVTKSRISSVLHDLGPYREIMKEHIRQIIPEMTERLQMTSFDVGEIEVELAAHGDGALFTAHIDTSVHHHTEKPRIISAVYYLHSEPKKFEGGNLLLHTMPFGKGDDEPKEIVPENNSLLAFPSFALHEVLPVIAPGVEFKDYRFAVNCWIHRA